MYKILIIALALTIQACGTETSSQLSSNSFSTVEFYKVGSSCDIGISTVLTRSNDIVVSVNIENVNKSDCEILIPKDKRIYTVDKSTDQCGSDIFVGKTELPSGTRVITITDNTNRFCKDLPDAPIVIEETFEDGSVERYLSR